MSADSTNACPACYARATGVPFAEVTQLHHLNDPPEGVSDASLKEYHENYINKGHVVFEYHGGECRDCGYSIPAFTLLHPIPGIT